MPGQGNCFSAGQESEEELYKLDGTTPICASAPCAKEDQYNYKMYTAAPDAYLLLYT